MRIIYSLLLFAIMAGATTIATDAYAQSNTERIKAIHETVLSMNGTLTSLVAPSDDDGITSSITSFGDILNEILVVAQSNQQTVTELASIMADMRTDLSEVHAALSTQDDTNLAEDIGFLTSTVTRNHATVLDRLDTIEATLSAIEGKLVSTPTTGSPTVTPGTDLVRDDVTLEVSAYTYKTNGIQRTIGGEEVYDLDLTFSCTGPANIATIRTDVRSSTTHPEIITNDRPHSTTDQNYLTVDGRVLYDSKFEASSGSYLVFIRSVSFENLESLATGDTLDFESRQHEVGTQIADSTRSAQGFSYEITVEYFADRSTTCSIGTGTGSIGTTGTGALPKSGSITLTPTLGTGLIRTFTETISCNNNPVDITSIETGVVGWQGGLVRFAELTLTFLDGSNDDTPDVTIDFNSDGTLVAPTYPISFSNVDLKVSGKLPNAENVIIEIDYNTVRGGSCSEAN